MIFNNQPRTGKISAPGIVFAGKSIRRAAPVMEGYAARSARNILSWKSYLAPDCVKTMIAMGWDRTT